MAGTVKIASAERKTAVMATTPKGTLGQQCSLLTFTRECSYAATRWFLMAYLISSAVLVAPSFFMIWYL